MSRPEALETRLAHRFADAALLDQALTHRSHGPRHNERLEFLGDGVLGCAIADLLYARFPRLPEGKLTHMRVRLVRKEALAEVGTALRLGESLRIGSGAAATESIIADAVEALVGAIFLDDGYASARAFVERSFRPLLEALDPDAVLKDAKTRLQEIMHARKRKLPEYRTVAERHSAQANSFDIECLLPDYGLSARGSGPSRQRAEQQAAAAMLEKLSE